MTMSEFLLPWHHFLTMRIDLWRQPWFSGRISVPTLYLMCAQGLPFCPCISIRTALELWRFNGAGNPAECFLSWGSTFFCSFSFKGHLVTNFNLYLSAEETPVIIPIAPVLATADSVCFCAYYFGHQFWLWFSIRELSLLQVKLRI